MKYTVKRGDTLSEIGQHLNVKWQEIAAENNIHAPYLIFPGEELKIGEQQFYIVVTGDSLSKIGQKVGVDWKDIASANYIKEPYVIYPKQKLLIPDKKEVERVAVQIQEGNKVYSGQYAAEINAAAQKYGVDPWLVAAVIKQESGFKQFRSSGQPLVSSAGAIGIMQLMPGTARSLGVNPYDLNDNINGGTKLLSQLLKEFNGNVAYALAGYNAGGGAVLKYGGVPPYKETQNYVKNILAMYNGSGVAGKH